MWMLPTLALIRAGKAVDYVVGFQELGGADDFPTSALEARLLVRGCSEVRSRDWGLFGCFASKMPSAFHKHWNCA